MRRTSLFLKYVVLFVGLVTGVLVINAALDLWFVYQENRRASIEVQREKAEAAAQRIESFIREIERQIGWVSQTQWAALPVDQRRFDYDRLLRQVPAITELVQLDRQGKEQLKVSRLSMNVVGSGIDRSTEPAFKEALAHRVWFGPVYFRKESEPYMTMAVAHGGRSGVTVAEVNLKLMWDVVSQIKIGKDGYAYVVDQTGRLVAHPDISLVLRGTDMKRLPQVAAALAPQGANAGSVDATNLAGVSMLSAHAEIAALNWLVFVEVPTVEAQQPVIDAGLRTLGLMVLGLLIAGLAGALLARRMVVPIRAMQAGAERIGSGELDHRLSIKTGDELESLANQFNHTAEALQQSYETLERRVEDRTRELTESLEQQTATAEILRAISESPTDVQPVLNAVVKAAVRFCGAADAVIILRAGDGAVFAAHEGPMATVLGSSLPVNRETAPGRAILDGRTCHLPDIASLDPIEFAGAHRIAGAHGFRASLAAPLLHKSTAIGSVTLRKSEVGPFTPRQIELLEAFASQAVIAIENVRLFKELEDKNQAVSESLEQQTATGDILRVISQSPTDVQPVFDAIVSSAVRLCDGLHCALYRYDGTLQHLAAHYGVETATMAALQARYPRPPMRETVTGRALLDAAVIHVADIVGDPSFPESQRITATAGYRSALAVPMMREGQPIGVIFVVRREAEAFSAKQVQLLETFASQAVIAVQNVRLFTELRESLEYQTAISDVLKVMSRSTFDLEPVLTTVIETAASLCRAQMGGVFQLDPDGAFRWKVGHALDPNYQEHEKATPIYPGNDTLVGRVALRGAPVTELDALADPAYGPRDIAEVGQVRSMLGVPMLRDGKLFGVMCLARNRVEAFTDKQVELVTVFADQAVIAIENVRLLNEIENRNKELAESLEIQTATSNVLGVISQSTFNLEPVLNTVATAAADLCHADEAAIFLLKDGAYRWAASMHINSAYIDAVRDEPFLPGNDSLIGRTALRGEVVQIEDAQSDPDYRRQDLARLGGVRTLLGIPLTRDGAMIGVMVLTRRHIERFTDKHVETLQVFADQAVIAIQNVRLITEIQDKSRQLEVASQHKSQFLANMSHELRTPLNAILGYTEMMVDGLYGDVPTKAQTVLERVQSNGKHLLGLINDVLDLSKIEAGQLTLAAEDYSVADMVSTVMSATESLARNKKLGLESAVPAGLPRGVADARRLAQVLLNLVGNAIKFTDEGKVVISAQRAGENFEISVIDTGPGIAPADQAKIFEEFQQVDNTSTRKKGGTGLGLSISRKIVELHGGRITVESEVGKGSTFKVTIPINATSAKEAAQ